MQTLYVVGITGMLGSAVAKEAKQRGYIVKPFSFQERVENDSVLINCAGAIPSGIRQGSDMVEANAMLPFKLAEACEDKARKFIQVSTDCVFSGNGDKAIDHHREPNPSDLYGASKALGEKIIWEYPNIPIIVVRTSFIGLNHGLLKWFSQQKQVDGYRQALWTGSTVWEVARGLIEIIDKPDPLLIEHMATERIWSKYDVLNRLNTLLDLEVEIKRVDNPRINRALLPTTVIRDLDDKFVATELWEKFRS